MKPTGKEQTPGQLQSDMITWLRFPLMLGVVFVHNEIIPGQYNGIDFPLWFQYTFRLFSRILPLVCVPLFFVLSGYLFFHNLTDTKASYIHKIKRRFVSLFIPYITWNILATGISLIPRLPGLNSYFSAGKEPIAPEFWLSAFWLPADFPLWYIRDLLLFFLSAPLIRRAICRTHGWIVPLTGIAWFLKIGIPGFVPTMGSVFFFLTGAYMGINKLSLPYPFPPLGRYLAMTYPLLIILNVWIPDEYLYKASIPIGMLAVLYLVPFCLQKGILKIRPALSRFSFFLYCFHGLVIYRLIALFYKIQPQHSSLFLLFYILIPAVTIALSYALWRLVKKLPPRFSALLLGK